MPINRSRYAPNWNEVATLIKEAAEWRCQHCGQECWRPGEKPDHLSRSEWTRLLLSVHHLNCTPEDNRPENLLALCAPCHLALHARTRSSNVSPGQLSLW